MGPKLIYNSTYRRHKLQTNFWKYLTFGIYLFRSITCVKIGNGLSTVFWLDLGLAMTLEVFTLRKKIPRYKTNVCVASVPSPADLHLSLQPTLSNIATTEL